MGSILGWYKWMGIVIGVVSFLFWYVKGGGLVVFKFYYCLMFWIILGLVVIMGYFGGNFIYGVDYLIKYVLGLIVVLLGGSLELIVVGINIIDFDLVMVYDKVIKFIFLEKCFFCYNEDKSKGGLVMFIVEGLQEGGNKGYVIVVGKVMDSEVWK